MYQLIKKRTWSCLVGILSGLLLGFAARAQVEQKTIVKGIVVNESKAAVVGATVQGEVSLVAAMTDPKGNFQLSLPAGEKSIIVTNIGYLPDTVRVTNSHFLTIILKENTEELSNIVVVGYGVQKKETLTGAIAVIKSESLLQSPVANISNALVGRVAGIASNQASGEAGNDATTIRIRGVATLNSNGLDPLVVIDGIQSSVSVMNGLDANEIENISVLKDASSTAVYGVRGANGVIIITTKRGLTRKTTVSFSSRWGVTRPVSLLKMLSSYDYALYRNEAIRNDGDVSKYPYLFSDEELWKFRYNRDYTPEEVEMLDLSEEDTRKLINSPALYYSSHDYIKEQFDHNSPQRQINLNIAGGSERFKYFISLGNFAQSGAFNVKYRGASPNSEYNRYNLRSNIDVDIHKNLKLSVDFGGQFATKTGILGSSSDGDVTGEYARHKAMMVTILGNTPFVGPGLVDGNLVNTYVSSKNPMQSKGGYGFSPLTSLLTAELLSTNTSNLNTNIRLKQLMGYLTPGLSVSGAFSYSDTYRKGVTTQNNVPVYSLYRNPVNPNEYIFAGGIEYPKTVSDNRYNWKWNQFYLEGKVDYVRSFGAHSVTGMILANAQKTFDPSLLYKVPTGLMGIASRITYGYDNRYLAEFNLGYNGSENFPEKKRFGLFPAFSLGWVATNEKFFPKNDIVTWLKIRGSYGEVGNDKIGGKRYLYLPNTWGYLPQQSGNGYSFGNTDGSSKDPYYTGAYESFVGNPDVIWERARKGNAGLEVNFFRNRLQFVGDVFMEKRDNILYPLGTIPGIVATTLPPANIGKVDNKGYELQLKWNDRAFRDFTYSIGVNMSNAVNKVKYMDEPKYPYCWMNRTGFSLGQYKGFRTDGFYNNEEEVNNRPYVSRDGNKVQVGDIRYVDINDDGVIDDNDQVPIGYSNLPRYSFGGNLDLGYKGFGLSLLFNGSYKGSMPMTSFYILNPFYMNNGAAFYFQYDNRWTPEKAEAGITPSFPRASLRTFDSQNGAMNDLWIRSTQFVRLKNAEISYTFKKTGRLENMGIAGIRVYVNGTNLLTWGSKLPAGFDPEQEDSGGASLGYLYPPMRSFNFGISIQH